MPLAIARRRPLPKPSPDADPRFRKVMENLKQVRGRAARSTHRRQSRPPRPVPPPRALPKRNWLRVRRNKSTKFSRRRPKSSDENSCS